MKHPINFIRWFFNFFDGKNTAPEAWEVRCSEKRGDERKIACEQPASGYATVQRFHRLPSWIVHDSGRLRGGKTLPELIFSIPAETLPQFRRYHRSGKHHKPCSGEDGKLQSRDIAVANEYFWISFDSVVVKHRENSVCTVAAADGEDGFHLRVGEHSVDISCTMIVCARQIAMFFV